MAIKGEWIQYRGERVGYFAAPERARKNLPGVVVISEIMGVNDQIEDVTRRIAAAGYAAIAPDFYAEHGVRPPALERERVDEAMAFMETLPREARFDTAARDAAMAVLSEDKRTRILESFTAVFSQVQRLPSLVAPLREAVAYLRTERSESAGRKVGCVGFCMGGGLSALLACEESEISGAAVYYGNAPAPEKIANIRCPVIGFYGELDQRVNAGLPAFEDAARKAGVDFERHVYPGVNHAFFNDSGPTYNVDAARDSFTRLLLFFQKNLAT
jgi:carboxymethylenebutenolidase